MGLSRRIDHDCRKLMPTMARFWPARKCGIVLSVGCLAFVMGPFPATSTEAAGAPIIETFAGSATGELSSPYGITTDQNGNVFIADEVANQVLKLDLEGKVSVVAGNGTEGSAGNGGPAVKAQLHGPTGVAVGGGNLFIADRYNNVIRKVDSDSRISTFAGNGVCKYSAQDVGDGRDATSAGLCNPTGIAIHPQGGLVIADQGHRRVRRVTDDGRITTIAGSGSNFYVPPPEGIPATTASIDPWAVAVADGEVYIAERYRNLVRMVDSSGNLKTVAGGGPQPEDAWPEHPCAGAVSEMPDAHMIHLESPTGIAIGLNGSVLVAEERRIFQVENGKACVAAGSRDLEATDLNGDGGSANAAYIRPLSVAADPRGGMVFSESSQSTIRKVDTSWTIHSLVEQRCPRRLGDGSAATAARLCAPAGVAVDKDRLIIADSGSGRVRVVSEAGIIKTFGGTGIKRFTIGGKSDQVSFKSPAAVATGSKGEIYIADSSNHQIVKIGPSSDAVVVAGFGSCSVGHIDGEPARDVGLCLPGSIAHDSAGNLYIAEAQWPARVIGVDTNGIARRVAGGVGNDADDPQDGLNAKRVEMLPPVAIEVGPGGNLFLAVTDRIFRLGTNGTLELVAGGSSPGGPLGDGGKATEVHLSEPRGMAFDRAGNLYFAERLGHRVRKVDTKGIITTVAGTGKLGFSGDGKSATNAQLKWPSDVDVDENGVIYVADTGNDRIRVIGERTRLAKQIETARDVVVPGAPHLGPDPGSQHEPLGIGELAGRSSNQRPTSRSAWLRLIALGTLLGAGLALGVVAGRTALFAAAGMVAVAGLSITAVSGAITAGLRTPARSDFQAIPSVGELQSSPERFQAFKRLTKRFVIEVLGEIEAGSLAFDNFFQSVQPKGDDVSLTPWRANDLFERAVTIPADNFTSFTSFTNTTGAFMEANERGECGTSATVWYRFTPTADIFLTADADGSTFGAVLGVYMGHSLRTLDLIKCDDGFGDQQAKLSFGASKGMTYYFQVGGRQGATGYLTFSLRTRSRPPQPANDLKARATSFSKAPFTDRVDTTLASITPSPTEDFGPCPVGNTVWYRFNPTEAGTAEAQVVADFDALIIRYLASPSGDVSSICGVSNRFDYEPGESYIMSVGGRSNRFSGGAMSFHLDILHPDGFDPDPPLNDELRYARDVKLLDYHDSYLPYATLSAREPQPSCGAISNSVWHRYTPQETVPLAADARGYRYAAAGAEYPYPYPTVLAVYRSTKVDGRTELKEVACGPLEPYDPYPGTARAYFLAELGKTYYLQSGARRGARPGLLRLTIGSEKPPVGCDLIRLKNCDVGVQ